MKIKKKLIKRIGAILCALVVAVSCLGSVPYYASLSSDEMYNIFSSKKELLVISDVPFAFSLNEEVLSTYPYFVVGYCPGSGSSPHPTIEVYYSNEPFFYETYAGKYPGIRVVSNSYGYAEIFDANGLYSSRESSPPSTLGQSAVTDIKANNIYTLWYRVYMTNHDIYFKDIDDVWVSKNSNIGGSPSLEYNPNIGYLQNVTRKSTYIRGELFNYDDESLTYHWYHDLTSTGGVDLTNGNYKIKHYVSNATVKGYEKSDIIEMSDKYLMAEYDASQGYFSYLQKDYLDILTDFGYKELGFIDIYLKGYFTLQHHYFQIVDTTTNEVGGYLHFYPKDASGDSFGVELEYEGLDDKFEVDEDAPSGFIDTPTGSGTTVEDALENADQPKLDDLGGIEPLIENIEGYASQITNVTSGIGALLGSLPPWVLGLLGLSVGMLFVIIAVKALRG